MDVYAIPGIVAGEHVDGSVEQREGLAAVHTLVYHDTHTHIENT